MAAEVGIEALAALVASEPYIEEWWHTPTSDVLRSDAAAKAVWREAVLARIRQRDALYALGYEQVDRTMPVPDEKGVLPTYTETWIGDLGTVTVEWNHDPTDPSV